MLKTALLFTVSMLMSTFAHAEACRSLLQKEDLRLWSCENLKVLVVKGTPEQRAEAHGRLLGKELSMKPLDLFADVMVDAMGGDAVSAWFADKALSLWAWLYDRKAPDSYHREVKSLATGAGISIARARRALLFPDTALFFWAMLEKSWFKIPGFACTSVAKLESDGDLVYGRNLDFYGVGTFDAFPMMVVNLPADGSSELKHLVFATDGMPFGGITGMNEKGLVFAVHQNYTRDANMGGVPMPYIGVLVLRSAKNIDEALQIIKNNRPGPLWTFILTDLNKGEITAVEVSKNHFETRKMENGLFSQSNHSWHDSVREDELIDVGTLVNSVFRADKAVEIVKAAKKGALAEAAAQALSYAKEKNGDLAVHLDVIKPLTIQTLIVEKKKNAVEVNLSYDLAPTSSGRFAGFPVEALWGAMTSPSLEFRSRNLSGTTAEARSKQTASAQAFAATISSGLKAVELLEGQKSAGALLAQAVLMRENDKAKESLEKIQQARSLASFKDEPLFFRQAFDWIEMASLFAMNEKEKASRLAAELLKGKVADPRLRLLAESLEKGNPSHSEEIFPTFDFFSGYMGYVPLPAGSWKGQQIRDYLQP